MNFKLGRSCFSSNFGSSGHWLDWILAMVIILLLILEPDSWYTKTSTA